MLEWIKDRQICIWSFPLPIKFKIPTVYAVVLCVSKQPLVILHKFSPSKNESKVRAEQLNIKALFYSLKSKFKVMWIQVGIILYTEHEVWRNIFLLKGDARVNGVLSVSSPFFAPQMFKSDKFESNWILPLCILPIYKKSSYGIFITNNKQKIQCFHSNPIIFLISRMCFSASSLPLSLPSLIIRRTFASSRLSWEYAARIGANFVSSTTASASLNCSVLVLWNSLTTSSGHLFTTELYKST